jgi:Protein of unknown function (DUF1161)
MTRIVLGIALCMAAIPVLAKTSCDEVKATIDAKLEKKGVKNYTIEAVDAKDVGDKKVVGSCEGGAKKLVYTRGK